MARGRNAEPDLEQGGEIVLMQFLSAKISCCSLTKLKPVCFYLNNKIALQILKFKHFNFSSFSGSFPAFFFTLFSFFQLVKIRVGFDGDILKYLTF